MDVFAKVSATVETVWPRSALGRRRAAGATVSPRTDWREVVAPSEDAYFRSVASEVAAMQKSVAARQVRPIDRGFHAKRHAILRGELTVLDGLPVEFAQGVFRRPGVYKTWVRFSNGDSSLRADDQHDIRGMGVKLLDVPGEPLTLGHSSLDFLTILQATQPARDILQFMGFVRASQQPRLLPLVLAREVGALEAARMLYWMATEVTRPFQNPLGRSFYTAVPLRWGAYAAKCCFRAVDAGAPLEVSPQDPDFVSRVVVNQLEQGPAHWELLVQLYCDPVKTPIEDASVPWRVEDAPYTKVADLRVDSSNLQLLGDEGEQARLDRSLAFSPWHAPVEHRPLGSIMRARRAAYDASARLRQADTRC